MNLFIFLTCLVLLPFTALYYFVTCFRNLLYDKRILKTYRSSARVISIGNITWGGTGKTPLTKLVAGLLIDRGCKVSILIRGYGGDETTLLSKAVKSANVMEGKDRVKNAAKAEEQYGSDVLILDDGFQYRKMERDLDIVCVDAMDAFGNGLVIPSGKLREGISGLKRADLIVITKSDLAEKYILDGLKRRLNALNSSALIVQALHSPKYFFDLRDRKKTGLSELKDREVILVSGIGNPASFEKTILNLGMTVKKHFIFRDHYWYKREDLEKIDNYCAAHNMYTVIMTEKDGVRMEGLVVRGHLQETNCRRITYLALNIEMEITDNEEGFRNRLFGVCNCKNI